MRTSGELIPEIKVHVRLACEKFGLGVRCGVTGVTCKRRARGPAGTGNWFKWSGRRHKIRGERISHNLRGGHIGCSSESDRIRHGPMHVIECVQLRAELRVELRAKGVGAVTRLCCGRQQLAYIRRKARANGVRSTPGGGCGDWDADLDVSRCLELRLIFCGVNKFFPELVVISGVGK